MTTIQRILVPTDFSNCSHVACDLALKFATKFGSSIELLHVDEPPAWTWFVIPELIVNMPNEASSSLHEFVQTRTRRALEQLVEALQNAGVTQVRHRMESGDPGAEIVRVAQEGHFDLIVMGTHGRKGFERLLMGSVAERVVRQAACPVLTVRAEDEAAPEPVTIAPPAATAAA
jgi:nucleotide-binding universal stress UspA family protein